MPISCQSFDSFQVVEGRDYHVFHGAGGDTGFHVFRWQADSFQIRGKIDLCHVMRAVISTIHFNDGVFTGEGTSPPKSKLGGLCTRIAITD